MRQLQQCALREEVLRLDTLLEGTCPNMTENKLGKKNYDEARLDIHDFIVLNCLQAYFFEVTGLNLEMQKVYSR